MWETTALDGCEVRDYQPERGEFTARIVRYDRADHHGSVWRRGVFTRSLEKRLPAVCWSHDLARIIGKVVDAQDPAEGLEVRAQLADPDAVPDARMARALLADRMVPGFSFTFDRHPDGSRPVPREQRSAYGLPAREFMTSADLIECSPVAAPSGVETELLSVRSKEQTMDTPSAAEIAALVETRVITPEQAQLMLREVLPDNMREHITVTVPQRTLEERVQALLEDHDPELAREVRDAGTMTEAKPGMDSPEVLASAVDAGLDSACYFFGKVDNSSLPDEIQQGIALAQAAGAAADDLLDAMGVDDPDDDWMADDDEGERSRELEQRADAEKISDAPWTFDASEYSIQQLAKAALIKIGDGSTKDDYKLPIRTPDGTLNANAIKAAAGALAGARGGVDAPDDAKQKAAKTLLGLYNQLKSKPPPSLLKAAGGDAVPSGDDGDDSRELDEEELERRARKLQRNRVNRHGLPVLA